MPSTDDANAETGESMSATESLDAVDAADLQAYLHEHIPLTRSMDVSVVEAGREEIVLEAPLGPNINHRDTAFGGSASALTILAGWALVHVRLRGEGHSPRRIVIQRNRMEYLLPVEGTFRARCTAPDPKRWARFLKMLERRGVGRVAVEATLEADGEVAGRFEGEYVVLEDGEA